MANLLIIEVSEDGSQITLATGHTYSVAPGDIPIAICWYGSQRVRVTKTKSSAYPYCIKNLDSYGEQTVRASSLTGLSPVVGLDTK